MRDIRTTIINAVSTMIRDILTDEQLQAVQDAIAMQLHNYELCERITDVTVVDNTPDSFLKKFIATKRIEGKSEATLKRYGNVCFTMIHTIGKPLNEITTYDLRYYLSNYKKYRNVTNRTLDGMRRCLSSFFRWLVAEEWIDKDPCAALAQIKYTKVVKKPYTSVEMERIKQACQNIRDLALVEFLYGQDAE